MSLSEEKRNEDQPLRIREFMIPLDKYPWIRLNSTLKDAVKLLQEAHIDVGVRPSRPRVLLVFDHRNELVGKVRRRDIMRGLEPPFLAQQPLDSTVAYFMGEYESDLSSLTHGLTRSQVLKGLRDQGDRPVADVVRPISITLRPQDPMLKAVYEMVSHNLSLIPVVEDGQVLGVVRSVDVLHELAGLLW